jgi:catechol 2,3-dioxygenase-like lactoylglutathione lyase family enzyme
MLGTARAVAFVGVRDLTAAKGFYGDVLGLRIVEQNPYALVADADGTMIRITAVETPSAAPYTVLGWDVGDIEATRARSRGQGCEFTRYDGMGQDELGIWNTPDGAKVAWFSDPDHNTLSLTQFR